MRRDRDVEIEASFRAVFRRRPELQRFVIQDRSGLPDHIDRGELRGELFVTQITLFPRRGGKQYDEIYADIARAITQLVDERPEALGMLPGRAFVRALH
jgi:hypothetical protein